MIERKPENAAAQPTPANLGLIALKDPGAALCIF